VGFKLFGCLLLEDGEQSKHVAARLVGIYISIILSSIDTKRLQSFTIHGDNIKKILVQALKYLNSKKNEVVI
jgi:hypothetical protein